MIVVLIYYFMMVIFSNLLMLEFILLCYMSLFLRGSCSSLRKLSTMDSLKLAREEISISDSYGSGSSVRRLLLAVNIDHKSDETDDSKIVSDINCDLCHCPPENSYYPEKCQFCCNEPENTSVEISSLPNEKLGSFLQKGVVSDTVIDDGKNTSLINFNYNCDVCKCPFEENLDSEKCKSCPPCESHDMPIHTSATSDGIRIDVALRNHSEVSSNQSNSAVLTGTNCELCRCQYEDIYNPETCQFCEPCESHIKSVDKSKVSNTFSNFKAYNVTMPDSAMRQFNTDFKENSDAKNFNSDDKIISATTNTRGFANLKLYVFIIVSLILVLVSVVIAFSFLSYKKAKYFNLRRNYL